jgi:hypothetical protein
MKFDLKKCFSVLKALVWIWIRTGSGFSNSLDPDPDFAKYLNRDSVNSDTKHYSGALRGPAN